MPRCLRRIQYKQYSVLFCDRTDFFRIVQISRQIGSVGTDDRFCIFPDSRFQFLIRNISFFITSQDRHFCPRLPTRIQRAKHRIMFHRRCDDMISRIDQSPDRRIQTFRRIQRKYDLPRIFAVKQPAQLLPRLIDHTRRAKRRFARPTSGVSKRAHRTDDRFRHLRRFLHRRRRIIHINHSLTSSVLCIFPFFSIRNSSPFV